MIPLRKNGSKKGVPYLVNSTNKEEIKKILSKEEKKFLPIVNEQMVLQKIAFLQKYDTNYIGMAITTKGGWKKEIEKWGPQVDTLTIDSSNACFEDAIEIIKYAKKSSEFKTKPFGVGNIIKGRDFKIFAQAGADYIIGGMGVGSICQTGSTRGNGRGQFTVAVELSEARDRYKEKRYVPIVLDGGIKNLKDMTVALAFADFIMMGNYFNKFYESSAEKFDIEKKITTEENLMRYVETWGEGHPRARLVAIYGINFRQALTEKHQGDVSKVIERYGHSGISSATVEGYVGLVDYCGRLKPNIEKDARYIRTTISNSGACDLASFRKKACVEKASYETLRDMLAHGIQVTEK
jgi:IMP dehydrogenase/GMP reductase